MPVINISEITNLTARVTELDATARGGSGEQPVKAVQEFQVERKVLTESSIKFKKMLLPNV